MRSFTRGVAVTIGHDTSGVELRDLRALAIDLERAGIDALVIHAAGDLEPITAAAALAPVCGLVLCPVVSTKDGRVASIVTKRATTLALLAKGRVALLFRAGSGADEGIVVESVQAALALGEDGPIAFSGETLALKDAYNEPRPDAADRLAVGAWTNEATEPLCSVADLVLSATSPSPAALVTARARLVRVVSALDSDGPAVLDARGDDADTVRARVHETG